MNLSLQQQLDVLVADWKVILQEALSKIDTYINSFEQSEFFSFSQSNEKQKQYKKEYFSFMCELTKSIEASGDCAARLAVIINEADMQEDEEMTFRSAKIFDLYMALEKELAEFTSTAENALNQNKASASTLLNSANVLKNTIFTFVQKL